MDSLATLKPAPRELTQEECQQISGGLIGPDQDLSEFPSIAWPKIRVALDFQAVAIKTLSH